MSDDATDNAPGGDASDPDDYLGEVLDDRFRLDDLLGEGAMGHVYRATQLSVERPVAVKILRDEIRLNENFRQRFSREAKVISDFNHPNIVRLIDFYEDDTRGLSYLVMELVEGVELSKPLDEDALKPAFAFELAYQIAAALVEAHGEGIVHRDLKLENIHLVPLSNGTCQVKVLDFGVALPTESNVKLTQAGQIFGTPAYMSPEQAVGEEIDARSDIYSLGVILFEMLTGRLPFRGETNFKMMMAQAQQPPPALSDVLPMEEIPADADALLQTMMAKTPEDRPADAGAVRHRIEEIRREAGWESVRIDADLPIDEFYEPWLAPVARDQGPVDSTLHGSPHAQDLPVDDDPNTQSKIPERAADEAASDPESDEISLEETIADPSSSPTDGDEIDDLEDDPTTTTWTPDTNEFRDWRVWLVAAVAILASGSATAWVILNWNPSGGSDGDRAAAGAPDASRTPAATATTGTSDAGSAADRDGTVADTNDGASIDADAGEPPDDTRDLSPDAPEAEREPEPTSEREADEPVPSESDDSERPAAGAAPAQGGERAGTPGAETDEETAEESPEQAPADSLDESDEPSTAEPAEPPPEELTEDPDPSGDDEPAAPAESDRDEGEPAATSGTASPTADETGTGDRAGADESTGGPEEGSATDEEEAPPESLPAAETETSDEGEEESASDEGGSEVEEELEENQDWLTDE